MILHIDNAAIKGHAARLERIGKVHLPVVIRQTLSKAAFDVKTVTMPGTAKQFISRKRTFFQANSKVVPAQGLDINTMRSTVGFVPKANDKSHAVEDLQQQEHGGGIRNRSLIALPLARTSNSWKKMVKSEAVMKRILGHLVDAKKSKGSSEKSRYTKAAVFAGVGGFVISEKATNSGGHVVFLITGINRFGGNIHTQQIPVFSVKRNRVVSPKPSHFFETASVQSAKKMEAYFIQLAEARLNKIR